MTVTGVHACAIPTLELFDAQGVLLTNVTADVDAVLERTFGSAGTYFLLASDDNGAEVGDYSLSLQRLNQPVGALPISYGQTLSGSLTNAAQSDAYKIGRAACRERG